MPGPATNSKAWKNESPWRLELSSAKTRMPAHVKNGRGDGVRLAGGFACLEMHEAEG